MPPASVCVRPSFNASPFVSPPLAGRSFVRDGAQREMLFDLDAARGKMFARDGKPVEYDLVSKPVANVLRVWVEVKSDARKSRYPVFRLAPFRMNWRGANMPSEFSCNAANPREKSRATYLLPRC